MIDAGTIGIAAAVGLAAYNAAKLAYRKYNDSENTKVTFASVAQAVQDVARQSAEIYEKVGAGDVGKKKKQEALKKAREAVNDASLDDE